MEEKEKSPAELIQAERDLSGGGLPPIPEPSTWDTAYGIDEAVAIAVVPERALIFWELAQLISAGQAATSEFRLIRLHLEGEIPLREASWPVGAIGRFQDSGLEPGHQYLYVIARISDGEEIPIMVTNPIQTPLRHVRFETMELPSSIDLSTAALYRALKGISEK